MFKKPHYCVRCKILLLLLAPLFLASCFGLKPYGKEEFETFSEYYQNFLPEHFELSPVSMPDEYEGKLNGRIFKYDDGIYKNTVYSGNNDDTYGEIDWLGVIGTKKTQFWVAIKATTQDGSDSFGFYYMREIDKNRYKIYEVKEKNIASIVYPLWNKYKRKALSDKELDLLNKLQWFRCSEEECKIRSKEDLDKVMYLNNTFSDDGGILQVLGVVDIYPLDSDQ